jgi:hypothetical protein
MELVYFHFPINLYGVMLNQLSTGKTLPNYLQYSLLNLNVIEPDEIEVLTVVLP